MKAKLAPKNETDAPEAKKQKVESQSVDKNKTNGLNSFAFVLQNSDAMQNVKQCIQTMRFSLARSAALAGKTAIVTASTDGIGLAIARRLGQDGAKVWISSRKESNVMT